MRLPFSNLSSALVCCVALSLGAGGLAAQGATGKVQGIVLDPLGQPLASAQVILVGTSFAALTSGDGFYFLNNVPAGVYDMRAQFIGYQAAQMNDVRILADQTLTADFQLSGAITLEAFTIVATAEPLVPRDQVASRSVVTGDQIDQLPIDNPQDIVKLQPGIVEGRGGQISIRGSRAREATIFIDGVQVRRMDTGWTWLWLPTNTLAEVSVTTGAMEASFGDAQAGVISYVTRAGGPTFTGTAAYETDEPMGQSLRTGWNKFEAALSGPILGNLTFSAGGTLQGQKATSWRRGVEDVPTFTFMGIDTLVAEAFEGDSFQTAIPHFVQWGGTCDAESNLDLNGNPVGCQGRVRPYEWETDLRLTGKLQYTYGRGSRLAFSALTEFWQGRGGIFETDQMGAWGSRRSSTVFVLNWVQQVFRRPTSELSWDVSLSFQSDRSLDGDLLRTADLESRYAPLGIRLVPLEFTTDWNRFGPGDPAAHLTRDSTGGYVINRLKTKQDWEAMIENVRYDRGTLRSYLGRDDIWGEVVPRMNPYGTLGGGFWSFGADWGQAYVFERRTVGRAVVDWQADRYNRFNFGAEGTAAHLARWSGMSWVYKFQGDAYTGDPYKVALFGQDRLDLGDVVIELGVRWDRYDTRAIFPTVPGRTFSSLAFDPDKTVEQMTCPTALAQCNKDEYVWYPSRAHTALSPRVRVAFPVTDRTGFRFSYAHQTQVPDFVDMYNGVNNDRVNAGGVMIGGDVDFERTIQFEFGIRHAFSPDLLLDIAAYNKDKVSDVAYRISRLWDPVFGDTTDMTLLTNADWGNVRGAEIQLIGRLGRVLSGQASYTYQNALGTGSDPYSYIQGLANALSYVTGERLDPVQMTLRTRDDRRHNIQGTFSLTFPRDFARGSVFGAILRNVGAYGTFQVRSGLPYTRQRNWGQATHSSGNYVNNIIEPLQSSETPWEKYFDLRVTKGFRLGPTDWTLYVDARNLFNFTNKIEVFAATGDVVNEANRELWGYDELIRMEQDAQASGVWISVEKSDVDGSVREVGAIDLTNLSATCPTWAGADGPVGCVMLQRTERRFGNGDGIYDVEEQLAALGALYELNRGVHTFLGAGRLVRLGLQVTF